jgi:hypothetical protein
MMIMLGVGAQYIASSQNTPIVIIYIIRDVTLWNYHFTSKP